MQPETTYQAVRGRILLELRKEKGMDQLKITEKRGWTGHRGPELKTEV